MGSRVLSSHWSDTNMLHAGTTVDAEPIKSSAPRKPPSLSHTSMDTGSSESNTPKCTSSPGYGHSGFRLLSTKPVEAMTLPMRTRRYTSVCPPSKPSCSGRLNAATATTVT